jgi:hypothetical protein
MKFIIVLTFGMLVGNRSEVVMYEEVYRNDNWILGYFPVRVIVIGREEEGRKLFVVGFSAEGMVWWRRGGGFWKTDDTWMNYQLPHPRLHRFRESNIRPRDVVRLVPPGMNFDF